MAQAFDTGTRQGQALYENIAWMVSKQAIILSLMYCLRLLVTTRKNVALHIRFYRQIDEQAIFRARISCNIQK